MVANAGFIVIKDGEKNRRSTFRDFYGPLDKGSAKPSFCYPKRKEALKEEVEKMERVLDSGHIAKEHEMEARVTLKTKKDRLKAIDSQEGEARKLFNENKDKWMERRTTLAEEIRETMPTEENVRKRRVNPHKVLVTEKSGLEDKKKEFIVLSRLAGEDSNVRFLQKEK
jgi:gas vesicle protein